MMKPIGHGPQHPRFGNPTLIGTVPLLGQLIEALAHQSRLVQRETLP